METAQTTAATMATARTTTAKGWPRVPAASAAVCHPGAEGAGPGGLPPLPHRRGGGRGSPA